METTALTIPADVTLSPSFVGRLEGMKTGALARWRWLDECYEVKSEESTLIVQQQ
jgi:hypothetical protein